VTRIQLVDLGRQYRSIQEEMDKAILEAVASTQYILGEEVARFEREWAAYCGVAECIGVSSGTAAIQLALEAVGIKPGDEVIAPANTFIASVLPIVRLGAIPVLVDCDPDTAQIDVDLVSTAVTSRTRAVIAVDLYGHPFDAVALQSVCTEHGLVLVEDACQAHGASYDGRPCGSLGDIAAFSFYPGKNLGAYGDGGAVVTDDPELAARVRLLRDLGQREKYVHVVIGDNARLDTVQAAVLRVKLRHLDGWNEQRRRYAATYTEALRGAVETPTVQPWARPAWHLYVIRSDGRDEIRSHLDGAGISTGMHYPIPLHLQPALQSLGYAEGDFPVTEDWSRRLLSLPLFAELEPEEVDRVVAAVNGVVVAPV
jgi:dTDP-4-amino-4,6-dideoxygalactose transaminase